MISVVSLSALIVVGANKGDIAGSGFVVTVLIGQLVLSLDTHMIEAFIGAYK